MSTKLESPKTRQIFAKVTAYYLTKTAISDAGHHIYGHHGADRNQSELGRALQFVTPDTNLSTIEEVLLGVEDLVKGESIDFVFGAKRRINVGKHHICDIALPDYLDTLPTEKVIGFDFNGQGLEILCYESINKLNGAPLEHSIHLADSSKNPTIITLGDWTKVTDVGVSMARKYSLPLQRKQTQAVLILKYI